MPGGWTLYHYEGKWYEKEFVEVEVSHTRLVVEIEAEEEDIVTITATSKDGVTYRGDYRYREGSSSNGEVLFERFRSSAGDVLIGEWHEGGGPTGKWIIKVNPA